MECLCGCRTPLTGKQKKWASDDHKRKVATEAVRQVRQSLGKGLDALLPEKPRGKAHFGEVIGNPRLEPLLMAIMQRKVMTSAELQAINGSMAISTDMSNIRLKGYPISDAKFVGMKDGRKVYEYRYEG